MRILFITWQFPNFNCTFILNEIVELIRQGHDVTVLSILDPEDGLQHDDYDGWNLGSCTLYLSSHRRLRSSLPPALSRFLCRTLLPYEDCFESIAGAARRARFDFIHADWA